MAALCIIAYFGIMYADARIIAGDLKEENRIKNNK